MNKARLAGYWLVGLAMMFAMGVGSVRWLTGSEPSEVAKITLGSTALLGGVLLVISTIYRLTKGDLVLRPVDAIKRAPITFCVFFAIMGALKILFASVDWSWARIIVHNAVLAIVMALGATAYRRRV